MTANDRSATAYTTLASLTERLIALQKLSHNWLVLYRAAQKQFADLNDHNLLNTDVEERLADWMTYCAGERGIIDAEAKKVSNLIEDTNQRIQNGVYND